jgi:hypothetical protein
VNYKEIVLPAGTFRCYENEPNTWVQVMKPGDTFWLEHITFNSKGKKK